MRDSYLFLLGHYFSNYKDKGLLFGSNISHCFPYGSLLCTRNVKQETKGTRKKVLNTKGSIHL